MAIACLCVCWFFLLILVDCDVFVGFGAIGVYFCFLSLLWLVLLL